jgi:hypothetical protein
MRVWVLAVVLFESLYMFVAADASFAQQAPDSTSVVASTRMAALPMNFVPLVQAESDKSQIPPPGTWEDDDQSVMDRTATHMPRALQEKERERMDQ